MSLVRELASAATMRVEDRSRSAAHSRPRPTTARGRAAAARNPKKVFVAPRLVFFLMRRRTAQAKDSARRVLFEIPARRWRQFRVFLSEEEMSVADLIYATGFLVKATVYPVAALLVAFAFLVATLAGTGLL